LIVLEAYDEGLYPFIFGSIYQADLLIVSQ